MIHFFTKGDIKSGSSRQRAFLISQELNLAGLKSVVHQPSTMEISETQWPRKARQIWKIMRILRTINKDDIVFLQRTVYNKYFWLVIVCYKLLFRRRMIFDFDDMVYINSALATKVLVQISDAVIVGSHALFDWAKSINDNTYLVPTSLDFKEYFAYKKDYSKRSDELVLGWIGGATYHYENLRLLLPVFKRLIEQEVNFRFILIGAMGDKKVYDLFNGITDLKVEFIDHLEWGRAGVVPAAIQKFDIGLMPLVDDPWNRSKCAYKAIEYMACGVVTIASPVGENNYLITDGTNGFLPAHTEDWVDNIMETCGQKIDMEKISLAAIKTIKCNYSFSVAVPSIIEIINNIKNK